MFGEKIIAIRKNKQGNITEVKTHTGRILSIQQAMDQAARGGFDSLDAIDEQGNWYINNSAGDGEAERGGNLSILPEF